MKRLYIEYLSGFMDVVDNVSFVTIEKPNEIERKNHLFIYRNNVCIDSIPLSKIKRVDLVNVNTMEYYFKYIK